MDTPKQLTSDEKNSRLIDTDQARGALRRAVQRKFSKPAYLVYFDVPKPIEKASRTSARRQSLALDSNSEGQAKTCLIRSVDALVVSLYPSRDYEVIAIQFATTESDLSLLKQLELDSHPALAWADKVFIATALEEDIIDKHLKFCGHEAKKENQENPLGVLALHKQGLKFLKPAKKLESTPIDRDFIACLIRSARTMGFYESAQHNLKVAESKTSFKIIDTELQLNQALRDIRKLERQKQDLQDKLRQVLFESHQTTRRSPTNA